MDFTKTGFEFVKRAKLWYTISIVITGLGILAMIYHTVVSGTPLRPGIDFTGGSIIQLQFDNWSADRDVSEFADKVQTLVTKYTTKEPSIQNSLVPAQTAGQNNLTLIIRADASLIANKEAQGNLYDEIRRVGGDFQIVEESEVGALMGRELTNKAIWGIIIGNILILLYITFRLSFDFAVFAIVALIHDMLVVLGVFALFNMEVNSSFVAIILTVVGYSVNDTIVIYDRVRENMKVKRHLPFDRLVNVSLQETLTRSLNTGLCTVLAIVALLVFGGASIRTFMIGIAVGIFTGTYSSIFVASMLVVSWRMRGKGSVIIEEKPKPVMASTADPIRVGYAERPEEEGEEDEAGQMDMIQVGQGSPKPKTGKRPKRRRRR